MVEAARETNRIVQTGTQQRSDDRFRQACELVRNGKLGKIKRCWSAFPGRTIRRGKAVPDSDPPSELNYDLWLGPAPQRPYNANRVHYNFRFFWDYSGGQMTNFGAHHLDIAQWGLGMDDSGPGRDRGHGHLSRRTSTGARSPNTCRMTYTYANGVQIILGQQQKDIPDGVTFIGEKGKIHVTRGKITADPPELLKTELTSSDIRLPVSKDHHANFLDCIKSRKRPICDVEIGHRTATVCHLGNIALRLGRKIQWDPAKEQIIGDADAAAMLTRPYREPWKLA